MLQLAEAATGAAINGWNLEAKNTDKHGRQVRGLSEPVLPALLRTHPLLYAARPAHLAHAVAAELAFPALCAHGLGWDLPHKRCTGS